jgi:CheY-like chemotaxis protein
MDGFEATAEIAQLHTGTPIIAVSANDNSIQNGHFIARGMSDHLNKPFTSRELSACLKKYLQPRTGKTGNSQDADVRAEEKLKLKLINNFLKNNKTVYHRITKAIDGGDIKLAHRLAHTLKGNAGILCKTRLQKAAEDVEYLLTNEENRMNQAALIILKTELDAVLEELAPFAAQGAPPVEKGPAGTLGKEETRALLDKLETLLDGGSTECLNLLGSLRLIPENAESPVNGPLIQELMHQIEYFEFDKAIGTFARLKQNMAVSWS